MKEKTFDEFWEELKDESPETRRELEVMEDCYNFSNHRRRITAVI